MRVSLRSFGCAVAIGATFSCVATVHGQTPLKESPAEEVQSSLRDLVFRYVVAAKPGQYPAGKIAGQVASAAGRDDLVASAMAEDRRTCVAMEGDPVLRIVARARATNIVIINESHGAPLERHFVGRVLRALVAEGYSIYAAEAFTSGEDLAGNDVLGNYGWYSNEPIFGRTVRLAKSLGYKLLAYEQTPDQDRVSAAAQPQASQINRREASQTENLMAAIFRDEPDTKVVIHVGDAHAWERRAPWSKSDSVWMAERLKMATGRDPLTISQIDCQSQTAASVVAETRLDLDGKAEVGSPVDLYVGHPSLAFRDGRPAWRQEAGDIPTAVPRQFLNMTERVIVEARPESASLGVVPTDRILMFPADKLPLMLPSGRYRVDGFVAAGRIETPSVMLEAR